MLDAIALLLVGLVSLIYGSELVIGGASEFDDILGLPKLFVGITVVAVGSSFPEVATSVFGGVYRTPQFVVGMLTGLGTTLPEIIISMITIAKDRAGIAVGTLFGSNITDPLFSFGVGAAVNGFAFPNVDVILASGAYMLVASTLVVALFFVRGWGSRLGAIGCISLYIPAFFV